MTIYIVRRESSDSDHNLETDCFTDQELAQEWADHLGEVVYVEESISRETLTMMKDAREPHDLGSTRTLQASPLETTR